MTNINQYDEFDHMIKEKFGLVNRVDKVKKRKSILLTSVISIIIILIIFMNDINSFVKISTTIGIVTIIPIHELLHFATSKYFGYDTKIGLYYVQINSPMKVSHSILITLMPAIVISFILIVLLIFFIEFYVTLLLIFSIHLFGCISDFNNVLTIYKFNKNYYECYDGNGYIRCYSSKLPI